VNPSHLASVSSSATLRVMSPRPAWRRLSRSLTSCHLSGKSVADSESETQQLIASSATTSRSCLSSSFGSCLPARRFLRGCCFTHPPCAHSLSIVHQTFASITCAAIPAALSIEQTPW
jgi:hypothetical protein